MMAIQNFFWTLRMVAQILLMCLVAIPVLSYATTINILSEELVVELQTLDESYVYTGSGFTALPQNAVHGEILLPNYDPYEPAYSSFSSMYWWDAFQYDDGFGFFGDANTDRYIRSGDYNPQEIIYTSSLVSFNMRFTVEGDGASLFAAIVTGSIFNSSITVMDLTTETLFSGGELLSGHEYYVDAWSKSSNGSGNENAFKLDFFNTQANIPEPSVMLLMIMGLVGLGSASRKIKQT